MSGHGPEKQSHELHAHADHGGGSHGHSQDSHGGGHHHGPSLEEIVAKVSKNRIEVGIETGEGPAFEYLKKLRDIEAKKQARAKMKEKEFPGVEDLRARSEHYQAEEKSLEQEEASAHEHIRHDSGAEDRHKDVKHTIHIAAAKEIERGFEDFPDSLKRRLSLDLTTNKTADYSRINLTEIFVAFNCNVEQSITQWRLAKIMDGIMIAKEDLEILPGDQNLSPGSIPRQIYDKIAEGKVDVPEWKVVVTNPKTGEKEEKEASLSDFAYLNDTLEANRALGVDRLSQDAIAYHFFAGNKDFFKLKLTDRDGKENELDLLGEVFNPRDTYADLKDKIPSFKKYIKAHQAGMQMVGDWRYDSTGHRELAGHAYLSEMDGRVYWIPTSGRLAARTSRIDLQKNSAEGGNIPLKGQPQEIGRMDENYGGVVEILKEIVQRNIGNTVETLKGTLRRMQKVMAGLTLDEEGVKEVGQLVEKSAAEKAKMSDSDKEKAKTNPELFKKKASIVYFCGKELANGGIDGSNIIKSMHSHYDASMYARRGTVLSDKEAADLVFMDVFAPCILNNRTDWMMSISTIYGLGGQNGAKQILQNMNAFPDFVFKMMCRDYDDGGNGEIRWKTFHSYNEIIDYVYDRARRGHINYRTFGVNLEAFKDVAKKDEPTQEEKDKQLEYPVKTEIKNEAEGQHFFSLLKNILSSEKSEFDYSGYLTKYINGQDDFAVIREQTDQGEPQMNRRPKNKKPADQASFEDIIRQELAVIKNDQDKIGPIITELQAIYGDDEIELGKTELDSAIQAFARSLGSFSHSERKKIIKS